MKILMIALLLSSCGTKGEAINPRTGEPVQTEGRQGDDGIDGQDGEAGTNGSDGVRGPSGSNGSSGNDGANGVDGTSGSDGSPAPVTTYICTVDSSGHKDKYYITIQVVGSADTTFEVKGCS